MSIFTPHSSAQEVEEHPAIDDVEETVEVFLDETFPDTSLEELAEVEPRIVKATRRDFFKIAIASAGLATITGAEAWATSGHEELEAGFEIEPFRRIGDSRHPERVHLRNRAGTVTVITSKHGVLGSVKNGAPVNLDSLGNIDAFTVDQGGSDWRGDLVAFLKSPHYKPVYDVLMKGNAAFLNTDCTSLGYGTSLCAEGAVMGAEGVAGTLFIADALRKGVYDKKIKEKNPGEEIEVKREGYAQAILGLTGAYLSLPLWNFIIQLISPKTKVGEEIANVSKNTAYGLHPEYGNLLTHLRDLVVAFKIQFYMQQSFEESGRPQRLACIFGRNHMLADTLEKSPTEILNEIAKWQWLLEQRFSTYYPDIDKWHSPTSHGRFALETFTKIMHNIQAYAGGEGLRQTEIEVPDLLKLFGRAGEAA